MSCSPSSPTPERIHVFWDEGMLKHDTGSGVFDTLIDPGFLEIIEKHPENSDRVKNMVSILKKGPISPFISWNQGRPALISELLSFHTSEYVDELIEANKAGGKQFCTGTILNPGSWDACLLAAGTTLSAMKHILDGHGKFAYALVRPPGHHAQPTQADGYCFLNNAGLAVQLAIDSGCERVAVVDIDVHYGNGTAEGFYRSDDVLTISLHMNHGSWGLSHPQEGSVNELGEYRGYGFNLNIPLPNGTGDRGYAHAMSELVVPAVQKFKPSMIVLVVGQDSSAVVAYPLDRNEEPLVNDKTIYSSPIAEGCLDPAYPSLGCKPFLVNGICEIMVTFYSSLSCKSPINCKLDSKFGVAMIWAVMILGVLGKVLSLKPPLQRTGKGLQLAPWPFMMARGLMSLVVLMVSVDTTLADKV